MPNKKVDATPEKVPAKPYGYNGRVLRINLSKGEVNSETISEQFCRKYLGGAGFIAYYLWKELKPNTDALSEDNILIFALGPISGLSLPGASRNCIGAKSPLTGGIAKSECGGYWMAELKRAGYDAIIIKGKSEKPVYLWVKDGEATLKDASQLWGKETKETQTIIRTELADEKIQVASIGIAGENLVRYACIMEGLHDASGRGGLGAVMGSKNLKAIAVRGHELPAVADEEQVKKIRQQLVKVKSPLSEYGTGGFEVERFEAIGNLPVRNFRDGLFPEANQIHCGAMKKTMNVSMHGCFACPVRCKKVIQFEQPYPVDPDYGGPEYETIAGLGSNCGVSNNKAIVKGNERCNAHSIDTISAGGAIAFAMECFEKGLLTKEDTGGIELRFGNDEAMLQAIELIARREGIGNLLAEGTARMSKQIGHQSEDYAMHAKGLEAPYHDPRISPSMMLSHMVTPTGADHCLVMPDSMWANEAIVPQFHPLGILEPLPADNDSNYKVGMIRIGHFLKVIEDSMVTCTFVPFTPELKVEILKAVTGWDTGMYELLRIGERILTLMRLFNLREGLDAARDIVPERFLQPKTDGVVSNVHIDRERYEKAKKFYYALMGWDANGVPLSEKVEELSID